MTKDAAPIGVFDSGIGGLSVLQALRHELPHEHFVYVADNAYAPYGEKGEAFVMQRTGTIARYLQQQHQIKALVIACNTATAAAVEPLRVALPDLPCIGVEPAIKPAAVASQTQHVGVIATRGTVESGRFKRLVQQHADAVHFHVQACDGLAHAIERSAQSHGQHGPESSEIEALCLRYIRALGDFGLKTNQIDTLVLGCTHYVFIKDVLRALLGADVQLMDTGAAVARQTRRVLAQQQALRRPDQVWPLELAAASQIRLLATGDAAALAAAAQRWLQLPSSCCASVDLPVER